jgi:hypothetical protein
MTKVRKLAENYVRTQLRTWNGRKISKRDVQKAIAKVTKALLEVKEASARAAVK